MHKMMFEDSLHPLKKVDNKFMVLDYNRYITLSRMLERYLSADKVGVIFSESANKLESLILNSKYDRLIVYYDLIYDNPVTISKLINLLETLIDNGISNVAVVPIHCIEWHCIKCFGTDCELTRIAVNCSDYTATEVYKHNVNHKKATHEKFCKAVMGEVVDKKFHGSCTLDEYNITEEEEKLLAYSLPFIFTAAKDCKPVIASQYLSVIYSKFIRLLKCDKDDIKLLEDVLNKYLGILEF